MRDFEALRINNIDDVRGNLTLQTKGQNGSTISWISENVDVITPSGEVIRPAHDENDVTVKLIATISLNDQIVHKEFQAHVKKMPKPEAYQGYLFSYFIRSEERRVGKELIYSW